MASYDNLSMLLGTYPDLILLRKFGPLSAQVLLHLQAELLDLADDLNVLKDVEKSDPAQSKHARSWAKANETIEHGGRSVRKELIEEAERKLSRYCELCPWPRFIILEQSGSPYWIC
jgi:hypothetical protein